MLIRSLSLRQTQDTLGVFLSITRVFVTEVHAPVVHVIQPQTNIPPSYTSQPIVPPYSTDSTGT